MLLTKVIDVIMQCHNMKRHIYALTDEIKPCTPSDNISCLPNTWNEILEGMGETEHC